MAEAGEALPLEGEAKEALRLLGEVREALRLQGEARVATRLLAEPENSRLWPTLRHSTSPLRLPLLRL